MWRQGKRESQELQTLQQTSLPLLAETAAAVRGAGAQTSATRRDVPELGAARGTFSDRSSQELVCPNTNAKPRQNAQPGHLMAFKKLEGQWAVVRMVELLQV